MKNIFSSAAEGIINNVSDIYKECWWLRILIILTVSHKSFTADIQLKQRNI